MSDCGPLSRRRLLSTVAAGALVTAGCLGEQGDPAESEPSPSTGEHNELDLREANVVDVSVEADGRSHTFDVTLHHDDDGEDGYANWWQVEGLDGEQLGRRKLLHPHSQQPFTRSETLTIPEAVSCVVVRGHDQTHGYGGRAAVVSVDSGALAFVKQGTEHHPIDSERCP